MVPIAARAAVRSPAERVGRDGDGPNAVCDVIRTRNASTFVPAPAPEPRDGSPKTWEQPLTLMNPENLAQRRSRACRSWCGRLTLDSLTRGLEAKTDVLVVAGTVLAGTRLLALGAEAVGRDERRDGVSAWRSRCEGKKHGDALAGDARGLRRGWDTHPTFTPSCFWYAFSFCSAAMLPEFVERAGVRVVKG